MDSHKNNGAGPNQRISNLNSHFISAQTADSKKIVIDGHEYDEIIDFEPFHKDKIQYFNKQGWGYNDSRFMIDPKKDTVSFTGSKYMYSGHELPNLKSWVSGVLEMDFVNLQVP
jgi:hypothetical protein